MKRGRGVSQYYSGFGCLIRRKQVDSAQAKGEGQQLAKRLSAFDLIAIDVNNHTQVPVNGTIVTGIIAATLAFFMDVEQLAGMVSVGTHLSFTMVAISVLILRYVPPNEVPLPSSLQAAIDSVSLRYSSGTRDINLENINDHVGVSGEDTPLILGTGVAPVENSLIHKEEVRGNFILNEESRRRIASLTIMLACVGAFVLTSAASTIGLPSSLRLTLCGIGGILLLSGLAVLTSIEQDDARHNFGHTGGFICPFVRLLPIACIVINVYLLINLGVATWTRVSIWLVVGVFVYAFYGRTHSTLQHAVYVPAVHVDEIYRESASSSN